MPQGSIIQLTEYFQKIRLGEINYADSALEIISKLDEPERDDYKKSLKRQSGATLFLCRSLIHSQ
jgi:hypothetical protein